METSLPNVNTSDGCFNIGVLLSNRDFTEDAINMRKYEPYLLNDNSILSRIALLKLGIFGEWRKKREGYLFALLLRALSSSSKSLLKFSTRARISDNRAFCSDSGSASNS